MKNNLKIEGTKDLKYFESSPRSDFDQKNLDSARFYSHEYP